ncbi:MAG: DUF3899 domain-containing protein [Erysipelotrichaceae bacterium]|nr:DUF3899 domain-containing protein [Erysipelotrichaceae bacterium]
MKLKNIRIRELIISLIISLLYPIARAVISQNHLIAFSDSTLIIGLLAIMIGIFNAAVLHGDYDIASYLAHRRRFKNDELDFNTYQKSQEEKRKDSFNYPLFIGIIFILISFLINIIA